jgi:hypothetical protein
VWLSGLKVKVMFSLQSDHPRCVFVNIIDYALMRAIRYSSKLEEFNHEGRAIKLILLYNGLARLKLFIFK